MSPVPHAGARVGWGFDAHPLDGEPPLIVGGVSVSSAVGASATSDGDVLAHAVTDAVLGACALADIGEHFPSGDPALAGADSWIFSVRQRSWRSRLVGRSSTSARPSSSRRSRSPHTAPRSGPISPAPSASFPIWCR